MSTNAELLQDQFDKYQEQLMSTKSYIKALKDMTAQHGTDKSHYESDLWEAENNARYYEEEIARLKKELGRAGKALPVKTRTGKALPQSLRPGLSTMVLASISFAAGVLVGSMLLSRGDGQKSGE